jgi:RecJ-like exonuclease
MKRRKFVASLPALALVSCNANLDKRKERYDEKECPFCSTNHGVCSYCNGTTKCSFCDGEGKRKTSTKNYPERGIELVDYEEECPYCKSSGSCRYCDGVGKCWACKGTGKIESWDFFEQHKKGDK